MKYQCAYCGRQYDNVPCQCLGCGGRTFLPLATERNTYVEPIRVACKNCGTVMFAHPYWIRKEIYCPTCGVSNIVVSDGE